MSERIREIGDYHFERSGPVTWRLREARSPHVAYLSDPLMDLLAEDARGTGETAAQIAAVTRLPNTAAVCTTPDTHHGYGSPIGTVYASPSTLSLAVVGNDISCGMSLLLTSLTKKDLASRALREDLLGKIAEAVPMGMGKTRDNGDVVKDFRTLVERGSEGLRDNIRETLRLSRACYEFEQDLSAKGNLWDAVPQIALARGEASLGSLGGGNHFAEIQSIDILSPEIAAAWGLRPDQVVVMIHSGSRAFGAKVADLYDRRARSLFEARATALAHVSRFIKEKVIERSKTERRRVSPEAFVTDLRLDAGHATVAYTSETGESVSWQIDLPVSPSLLGLFDPMHAEADLAFAHRPLPGSGIATLGGEAGEIAEGYWTAVQAAQNFAVLSRTIMQYRIAGVLSGTLGRDAVEPRLLYDISHNNVQVETVGGKPMYVHRKGATRAFPALHAALAGTPWMGTGHPVLVPGSMGSFSYVMRAVPTASGSLYSVNHGAGRAMSRKAAARNLDPVEQQAILDRMDVVTLGASIDEMPSAYKSIDEVVRVCVEGGLCEIVARAHPMAVAKGDDAADD